MPSPPGNITTRRPPLVSPSSPWSAWPFSIGTPIGPLALPLSPPKSHLCTVVPTKTPPYISYHGPAPLLLSYPISSRSSPTASALSSGSNTPTANHFCYRRSSDQGKGRPNTVVGPVHWSGTRSHLPQSSSVGSCGGAALLSLFAVRRHMVMNVQSPWWNLATSALALWEVVWVFL